MNKTIKRGYRSGVVETSNPDNANIKLELHWLLVWTKILCTGTKTQPWVVQTDSQYCGSPVEKVLKLKLTSHHWRFKILLLVIILQAM